MKITEQLEQADANRLSMAAKDLFGQLIQKGQYVGEVFSLGYDSQSEFSNRNKFSSSLF